MSKTRDNSPELDYFELRRRHEEYKRARTAPSAEKSSVEERLERQVAVQHKPKPAPVKEELPIAAQTDDAEPALDIEPEAAPADAFEEAIAENYEAYENDADFDEDFDEEPENENPNPFDSFIRFFHGVKDSIASRRSRSDELEDLELDDLTDEELAELDEEDFVELDGEDGNELIEDDEPDAAPSKPRFSFGLRRAPAGAQESELNEDVAPVEDVADIDEAPPRPVSRAQRRAAADEADELDDDEFYDEDLDFDDEDELEEDDFDDELDDDFESPRKSGLKRFINLFVTRIDEEEADEDELDEEYLDEEQFDEDTFDEDELDETSEEDESEVEEIEAPVRRSLFSRSRRKERASAHHHSDEDDEFYNDFIRSVHNNAEGGQDKMEEINKQVPAATPAAENEGSGMTRRQRRELAMRLAAEEAARKAEEEAKAKAEAEKAAPLFAEEPVQPAPVDMGVFEDAPKTDLIVETTAKEMDLVDEPTREFTPVNMRALHETSDSDLFGDDDEDEDYDDEDKEEVKKPRRSLFGRKRARDEDDYDEDDDEDEDDEDYDEDDEDEEEVKKPRRSLFGRKRAKDEDEDDEDDYDEDEDDDEYDDEDDDEYDEYDDDDDYDDEDDDEYDDYDDEEDDSHRSFGHHLIGFFKIVLAIILVLLVAVIGLNFHYYITGENAVLTSMYDMLSDTGAADVLCFGYNMRQTMSSDAANVLSTPEPEIAVEPTALPQSTAAIPNLDNNGDITETPVIEAAPVIETAPVVEQTSVDQAPVAGAVG